MSGIDGFLGTRASFMLDVVVMAMAGVLPVLAFNIYLVRSRRRYALHKRMQLVLGVALLVTVALFEADMRVNGWRHRAAASAFAAPTGTIGWIEIALAVHLCFSVTTALLWILVTVRALRQFPDPPEPGPHSAWHRRCGWAATLDLIGTAVTGWIFYWLAFVA